MSDTINYDNFIEIAVPVCSGYKDSYIVMIIDNCDEIEIIRITQSIAKHGLIYFSIAVI